MARNRTTHEAEPAMKSCRNCSQWQAMKERLRISKLLLKAVDEFEENLKSKDLKLTLTEFLKLLQLEKEMEKEEPKEIRVSWVEPTGSSTGT